MRMDADRKARFMEAVEDFKKSGLPPLQAISAAEGLLFGDWAAEDLETALEHRADQIIGEQYE